MNKKIKFLLSLFFCFTFIYSQSKVQIIPEKTDWFYDLGEHVNFNVVVSGIGAEEYLVYYEVGAEKMPPTKSGSFKLSKPNFSIAGGTMLTPGFLRCTITISTTNKRIREISTVAFAPEDIKPTIKEPKDFKKFWDKTINDSKKVPLDLKFTLLENRSTDSCNVYQVEYQGYEFKNRAYGILTLPKKPGKYPAIIRFPGAGVHPLGANTYMADKDVITLNLYIHPFPITWDISFYDSLKNSAYINYRFYGVESKETYFFKRVISGCVRAVDVIYSLPQFDGENLAAWGSSQGGGLSIITTALDKRIKMLVALCPAMCDYTGYLHNRAGGSPHFFSKENIDMFHNKEVLETLPYYDAVNFAKMITVPGYYSWGFNDVSTPPTSFYSAYNMITAPKETFIIPEGVHKIYPEQMEKTYDWIMRMFKQQIK